MSDGELNEVTTPYDLVPGGLRYRIWDQTGQFVYLTCKDTPHNRRFIVWLRKFDRRGMDAMGKMVQPEARPA